MPELMHQDESDVLRLRARVSLATPLGAYLAQHRNANGTLVGLAEMMLQVLMRTAAGEPIDSAFIVQLQIGANHRNDEPRVRRRELGARGQQKPHSTAQFATASNAFGLKSADSATAVPGSIAGHQAVFPTDKATIDRLALSAQNSQTHTPDIAKHLASESRSEPVRNDPQTSLDRNKMIGMLMLGENDE